MKPTPDPPPTAEPAAPGVEALTPDRPGGRNARTDTLSSDFTASVHDMLQAVRDPAAQGRVRWHKAWVRSFVVTWIVLRRLVALARLLLQRWIRHHAGFVGRALETTLWPLLFIYLAWVSNPGNPFYVNQGFPWPWLGPWLIALRYGVGHGAVAGFALLGVWALLQPGQPFPRLYFLGGAITLLITGEFGGYWRLRVRRLLEGQRFLDDKVERLTRRLYLLKASHDELEYEMVDRPGTLREALIDLRVLMDRFTRENPGELHALPGAQMMLDFVVHHCRVESAAIYEVRMEPVLRLNRVALVGRMDDPQPDDPMVIKALESGHQVHLQDALLEKVQRASLIAATPLLDIDRQPLGVMVIRNMPFTALTADNLQTVAVLLESYADYLRLSASAGELLPVWPEAPRALAGEFGWLTRLRLSYGLESRCVVWRAEHPRAVEILAEIMELHSRGETAWRWPLDTARQRGEPCVIVLVPFTDPAGLRVYKQRIFDGIERHFGEVDARQLNAFDFELGQGQGFARLRGLVEQRQ